MKPFLAEPLNPRLCDNERTVKGTLVIRIIRQKAKRKHISEITNELSDFADSTTGVDKRRDRRRRQSIIKRSEVLIVL